MKKLTRDRIVPVITAECFLADIRSDRLRAALLAEIRQQEQQARQPFFTGVEELVDQILFNPAVAGQQIGHEQLGKLRLIVKRREHGRLRYRGDQALLHRCRRRDTQRMAVHAAFAKELAGLQNADHCFLALLDLEAISPRRNPAAGFFMLAMCGLCSRIIKARLVQSISCTTVRVPGSTSITRSLE